jgi:hypothetical protein
MDLGKWSCNTLLLKGWNGETGTGAFVIDNKVVEALQLFVSEK